MQVAVIGGGPAGSVAAAWLAQAGHRVRVYEAVAYPRFHIGESLLPCNLLDLAPIGIDDGAFAARGFVRKRGAWFETADGAQSRRFDFSRALPGDPDHAYQVERAAFDAMLLERAAALGAELRQPCRVRAVTLREDGARVETDDGGCDCDFVVDASGRDALLARQLGIVDREGDLRRAAFYGHIPGTLRAAGAEEGDILITMHDDGWSWQIPLAGDKTSVGMVLERDVLQGGGQPQELFRRHLERFPVLQRRLAGRMPERVHATPDISYRVRRRHGRRWAAVGDASGFVDPIFSSGVLLGTRAGRRLAQALIADGPDAELSSWAAACDHDLAVFTGFIRLWYQQRTLRNIFFAESVDEQIYRGITSLLAGNTTEPRNRFLAMLLRRIASGRLDGAAAQSA